MSDRAPSLIEVIEKAINSRMRDTHCALPARVESYDADTQKVSVLPLLKGWRRDGEGKRHSVQLPVVTGVPVVFPGAGGFRLTFPVAKGDTVLLVFADYCVDIWLNQGGVVDPIDERTHNLSDAIAIPGLRDFGHALSNAPTDGASMGHDSGPTIHFRDDEVQLGGDDASQPVLLGSLYHTAVKTVWTALVTALEVPAVASAPLTGTILATAISGLMTAFETAATASKSSTVKVK